VSGTTTHWQRDAIAGFYMLTKMQIEQAKVVPVRFIESSEVNLMFYCFAEGSQVLMGDGNYKSIEFVRDGDTVLTYNFKKKC
jgi:hypothetical protein